MDSEKVIQNCIEMIRIPTVNSMKGSASYQIEEYKNVLRSNFRSLFSLAETKEIGDALLLYIRGKKKDLLPVIFVGHMDVVAAPNEELWKYPPFSGKEADGCIWGRGTIDMKGVQCILLSAFDELLEKGFMPGRDIYLYLSCDEETGGATTSKAAEYLKSQGVKFQAVFDEGGSIGEKYMDRIPGRYAELAVAEKGSLAYEFTIHATGGHAANPPKDSAIVKMARLITAIEDTKIFRSEITKEARTVFNGLQKHMDEKDAEILESAMMEPAPFPKLHELYPHVDAMLGATIAFTVISGGTAFNVMPSEVKLIANVRVASNQNEDEITGKLQEIAEQYSAECRLIDGGNASKVTSEDAWAYKEMKSCLEKVFENINVFPTMLYGGTDSKHFQDMTKETIRFSPLYLEPWQCMGVHGVNECISKESLIRGEEFYRYFLSKL
jgi:carboxypeptidase PM20D1